MTLALQFGWRHLLFANWPVDPVAVEPHVPDGLAVETYGGDAWLSVVAFENVDTRPRGFPPLVGIDLPEVNLRTYVTADGEPGVYFFSLDVPSLVTVLGARLTHHLPYFYASGDVEAGERRVSVHSRRRHPGARPARFSATCEPSGEGFTPDSGSLAAFLTERRRLYTEAQDGGLRHTDVDHPSWRLYEAEVTVAENSLCRAAGFSDPDTAPRCYYSPGVDVTTTGSEPWTGPASR